MKRERDPTAEEFAKLLVWFDGDSEVAGTKYESRRAWLIRVFAGRGCEDPARLADEVMNRVAVRIDKLVSAYDDPIKCLHGFAENVYREYLAEKNRTQPLDDGTPAPLPPDEDELQRKEQEDTCLSRCLAELSRPESDLFRRYFQEVKAAKIKARKNLQSELQLTANALRIKAFRIRRRLRVCMEGCLEGFSHAEMNRA